MAFKCDVSKLFHRKKVRPTDEETSLQRRQTVGNSYNEHHLTLEELKGKYSNSNIDADYPEHSNGLTSQEAKPNSSNTCGSQMFLHSAILEKRIVDGDINVPKEDSNLKLFFKQFLYEFWILLIAAGILSLITYFIHLYHENDEPMNLYCAIILFGIVIIMSILSYFQLKKTQEVVSEFKNLRPQKCYVVRDCQERLIPAEDLVIGDLVNIRRDMEIPADLRIIRSNGLKIESYKITGEQQPLDYTHEPAAPHISVFDAKNVAFKGSYCIEGDGIGIVIRIGQFTLIDKLAELQPRVRALQQEVSKFVRFISMIAICMAFVFFIISLIVTGVKDEFTFENILYHFLTGFLVVIVSAVPPCLSVMVNSQLAIIARRMAKKNVFIKKLDVIYELGAATVIVMDKTDTLTQMSVDVMNVWYNKRYFSKKTVPAIKQCEDASIKVFMVSGENRNAAVSAASKIGLIGPEAIRTEWHDEIGEAVVRKNSDQMDILLSRRYNVFYSTTPDQKLKIVKECQTRGEIVAVTGGGVNDPALAKANVGIAMGVAGCDIAQKTADIILTDDNFASIVKGIEEGRLLFDNLRLSIAYTLAHLWPEVCPIFLNFALGMPLGLGPLQILTINLASELPHSVYLAYVPPRSDIIMTLQQRAKNKPKRKVFHFFMCTTRRVSFFQVGVTNVATIFAAIIGILLLILLIYVPGINYIVEVQPPPPYVWIFGPIIGLYLIVFNETRKFFIRRSPNNRIVKIFKW